MQFEIPNLRDPVVIIAFSGWNDAGQAATRCLEAIGDGFETRHLFTLDDEDFYDFQSERPEMRMSADNKRELVWPSIDAFVATANDRDLVLIGGPEPNLRWRTFCDQVVGLIQRINPTLVVMLGCMITDDPHSRPLPVMGACAQPELAAQLGLKEDDYIGPTGITGVLATTLNRAGLPVASLWGSSPHYGSDSGCPKAALAILSRLGEMLDMSFDESVLARETNEWIEAITIALSDNPDQAAYIAELERIHDEDLSETTGDEIADEFQRYLRKGNRSL